MIDDSTLVKARPRYYRLLEKGEAAQKEDIDATWETWDNSDGLPRRHIWHNFLRPVTVDPWIEYAKQKPTKEDFEPTGTMECMYDGKPYLSSSTNCEFHDEGYWRRITPPQPAKPKSVTVQLQDDSGMGKQTVTIHADGHASTPCGSYYSAESIDAFIQARLEVTKKDL